MTNHSTSAPDEASAAEALPETVSIDDIATKVCYAKELSDLLRMAGEGLLSRLPLEAHALVAGSGTISETLAEVTAMLEAVMEGGAV